MAELPQAVARQIEAADALEKQMFGTDENPPEQDDATPPEGGDDGGTVNQDSGQPPTDTPTPPAVPEMKVKAGREDDLAYWRDRAYTLYGMNQRIAADMEHLQSAFKSLQAQVTANTAQAKPNVGNERDVEAFGDDLVQMVERRAADIAKAMVAQKEAEFGRVVSTLQQQLGNVNNGVAQTKEDMFYNALDRAVPDWQTINQDQSFLRWLGEEDGVSGVSRQAVLTVAENQLDAGRVATVFRAYLNSRNPPAKPAQDKTRDLQRQVSPATTGAASGGDSSRSGDSRMWTLADYRAAIDPQNKHRLGRQQALKMAADAEKALLEGRVNM